MDISNEEYEVEENHRSGASLAVPQTLRRLVSWLNGLFTVTEEDLSEAGVYLGGEGRD